MRRAAARGRVAGGLGGVALAVGCAGFLGACDGVRPDPEELCIVWSPAVHPLLVGDTARLRATRVRGSDCVATGPAVSGLRWRSADSAIVTVAADGVVRGRAPGNFRVEVAGEGEVTHTDGYVLPVGWRVRVDAGPGGDSVVARVGDTVRVRVWAESGEEERLPAVPFHVVTPEYLAWAREVVPDVQAGRRTPGWEERGGLFDRQYAQSDSGGDVVDFVAQRAGVSRITARIGDRTADVRVVVRAPRVPPAPTRPAPPAPPARAAGSRG